MLFITLLACGPKLPLELSDPYKNPHAQCPIETHFVAVGSDKESNKAIRVAHMRIAEQVNSQIQSSVAIESNTSFNKSTQGAKVASSTVESENLSEKINVQSSFKYNELIKDVIPSTYDEKTQAYYALSCLHKKQLYDHIYATIEQKVESSQQRYDNATEAKDVYTFSKYYQDEITFTKEEESTLLLLDSLKRGSSLRATYNQNALQLSEEADKYLRNLKISFSFDDSISKAHQNDLELRITKDFEDSKFKIFSGEKCATNDSYHLLFTQDTTCSIGNMGHMCKHRIPIIMTRCSDNNDQNFVLTGFNGKSQTSEQEALKLADTSITNPNFAIKLREGLTNFFPIKTY